MYRSATLSRRAWGLATAISATAALAIVPTASAIAAPAQAGCDNRTNNTSAKLLECVRPEGVVDHLLALQKIADENGGTRAAGTTGYDASVGYVVKTLKASGWKVSLDEFDYTYVPPPSLRQLTPVAADYETGIYTGTGYGALTGTVIPVDLVLDLPRDPSTSACEPEDFAGLDFSGPSDIALIQRGTCAFAVKALNAEAAGAEAVVIFNQGNTPDRSGLSVGTLGGEEVVGIPVVGASFADGAALAQPGSTAFVEVKTPEERPQVNVIAELPGVNAGNVVMAGAHLDSVQRGAGINDNGSGSAGLLELAQQLSKVKPQNTLRFAWWGAEEDGLLGSTAYVDDQSQQSLDQIALYLNFDMIGSPNYMFTVYDGDQSGFTAPVTVPEGSVQIEDLFESYFTTMGVPYDDSAFDGRSDYQAFILAGIPAGGLFTGAEEVKTDEQAAIWGGTAGAQLDPCYHAACDTIDNLSMKALDVNSDAIALAVLTYAYSTQSVNGVVGARMPGNFPLAAPGGPQGTVGDGSGGGGSGGGAEHGHDE